MTTYGEMFAGYGGLSMGLRRILGGDVAWWADNDPAASKVMARYAPHAPNLGDVTRIDWGTVQPVDVLTGGTPCQDLSSAGNGAGMMPGTRSGLWDSMCRAIAELRPPIVVWENVKGALSAKAFRPLESCPWCVGDESGTTLRALGRVLGDLATLGYDAQWCGLRASEVGACHRRWRVFVFAVADPQRLRGQIPATGRHPAVEITVGQGDTGAEHLALLPTPAAFDMGYGSSTAQWEEWTAITKVRHGNGNGHGDSLAIEALRLMPTPTASDVTGGGEHGQGANNLRTTVAHAHRQASIWGQYAPAIDRHAAMVAGRPPPPPTEAGRDGPRLSPRFVEWMMGLPDGHVTAPELHLTARHALRVLGNGVVPQQAAAATAWAVSTWGQS